MPSASSISPLSALDLASAGRTLSHPGRATAQSDFAGILSRADFGAKPPEEQARAAAEQFVSIALVQPLLAQLRGTNQAAPPFAPSQGEKQFQTLLDAQTAQNITRAKRFPLVDAIATQLLKRLSAEPRTATSPASGGGSGPQPGRDGAEDDPAHASVRPTTTSDRTPFPRPSRHFVPGS